MKNRSLRVHSCQKPVPRKGQNLFSSPLSLALATDSPGRITMRNAFWNGFFFNCYISVTFWGVQTWLLLLFFFFLPLSDFFKGKVVLLKCENKMVKAGVETQAENQAVCYTLVSPSVPIRMWPWFTLMPGGCCHRQFRSYARHQQSASTSHHQFRKYGCSQKSHFFRLLPYTWEVGTLCKYSVGGWLKSHNSV